MLFLLGGRFKVPGRVAVGFLLLIAGLVIQHGAVLAAAGAVFMIWGVVSGLSMLRSRRQGRPDGAQSGRRS
jgi:hypothetical protein